MTLHLPSIAMGFILAYALTAIPVAAIFALDAWQHRKKRREVAAAIDRLLAEATVYEVERGWTE